MTTRQTPELVPATERQIIFLATLAIKRVPNPINRLVSLLDGLHGVELTEQERDGFLCKQRASEIITTLQEKK